MVGEDDWDEDDETFAKTCRIYDKMMMMMMMMMKLLQKLAGRVMRCRLDALRHDRPTWANTHHLKTR